MEGRMDRIARDVEATEKCEQCVVIQRRIDGKDFELTMWKPI